MSWAAAIVLTFPKEPGKQSGHGERGCPGEQPRRRTYLEGNPFSLSTILIYIACKRIVPLLPGIRTCRD